MLNNPAAFGRQLNFGQTAPIPMWRAGEAYEFPNALGLQSILQLDFVILPPDPVYGEPFITARANMRESINVRSVISEFITRRSRVQPVISRLSEINEDE